MIRVYHAGYEEIKAPDVHRGRINADFGQGFYTTDDFSFASRWAREKKGTDIIINIYELDESELKIKRFERDVEWFRYIFSNRRFMPDSLPDYDVIMGPVANDTIYNTMGIMTSGYLTDEEAKKLLCVGPGYRQITLKSLKAAEKLKFISSKILTAEEIKEGRTVHEKEEDLYLQEFAKVMQEL